MVMSTISSHFRQTLSMWPSTSPFTNAPTRLPSTFPPFGSIFQCSHRRYTWHEQKRQRTKKKTKKKKKKKKKKKGLKVDKQEELQRGNQSKHADVANEGREQDKHTRENKGKKKKKKKKKFKSKQIRPCPPFRPNRLVFASL
jgi:hypothetical protein